jgi:hypothetical protein
MAAPCRQREEFFMTRSTLIVSMLAGFAIAAAAAPAQALTMQECSAKYEAAKTAGTLGGKKWNDFRKAECGSDATPAAAAKTDAPKADAAKAAPPAAPKAADAKPAEKPKAAEAAKPAAAAPSGPAVFPSAVSPKYASEKPGTARMHTCLDQYNANKANNGNGDLKWIQKGGGYYSQCTAKLKS